MTREVSNTTRATSSPTTIDESIEVLRDCCSALERRADFPMRRIDSPPRSNLAERQLRPAVIARKVSCGNKTPKGAQTWGKS